MKFPIYVAIPVYNGGKTIKKTLDNLARQTYSDFTILVYNDGSTDWTDKIVRKTQASDPRIKIISGARNEGRGAARNHLLEAAKNGIVAWQDADDTWHPTKLQEQINFFDRLPEMGIEPTQAIIMSTFDRVVQNEGKEFATIHIPPDKFDINYVFSDDYGKCPFQLQATFGLAEVYRSAGGFDPELNWSEDFDIALKILRSGQQILSHKTNQGLAKYYHSFEGVDGETVERAQRRLVNRYRDFAKLNEIDIDAAFLKRRLGYLFSIYMDNKNYGRAIYTALSAVINADEQKLLTVSRHLLTVFRAVQRDGGGGDPEE